LAQLRETVHELLADKGSPLEGGKLSGLLSQGTWTHDHPLTYDRVKSFGLPVRCDIPAGFVELISLYTQPVRHQPTVEYLPLPRRLDDSRKARG